MGFGTKLSKSVGSIGTKISKGTQALGAKVSKIENQAQKGIAKGIQMGQGAVRDVERGIVAASGKVGAIKQGLNTGARVIDALQTTGLTSMIPGLGVGLGAVSAGLKSGSAGLQRLQDVGADSRLATGKVKNQLATVGQQASTRVGNMAGQARNNIEKVGERSRAIQAQAQEDISNINSAFHA
jgi:hypothetical protein